MMYYEAESARCRVVAVPCPPDSHPPEADVLSRHDDTLKRTDRMPCGEKSINAPRDLPGVSRSNVEDINA